MLKKDMLMSSRVNEIPNIQIPVQHSNPEVEEVWTNNFYHYPTPSPTSTSSSDVKAQFSPGPQYEWTLLNPGSLDLTTVNNWSHQMQTNWLPDLDTNIVTSAEPAQQILTVTSHQSTHPGDSHSYYHHDWVTC